jgi:hypothetical protein
MSRIILPETKAYLTKLMPLLQNSRLPKPHGKAARRNRQYSASSFEQAGDMLPEPVRCSAFIGKFSFKKTLTGAEIRVILMYSNHIYII